MEMEKSNKPKWLRRLERESWQAELIISGAAIFGALQLPDLLEKFQFYLLLNYERGALFLWFFASSYWALFVYCLIFIFIYHFIIRALWIGLVGLNSVYPEGFAETNLASKDYQEKVKKEYGDIDGFINRLDKSASSLFGTGFTFAGLFLNLGILASISILVITWMQERGVESFSAWTIGLSPIIFLFTLSILSSFLSLPSLREKKWVKRIHFPVVKIVNQFIYPVNNRFTVTGLMLISSQSLSAQRSRWSYVGSIIASAIIFFLIGVVIVNSNALKPEFTDRYYHRMGDTPTDSNPANYESSSYDGLIYEPQLSERYPKAGGPFWTWVPLPERELVHLRKECTLPDVPEGLERSRERKAERQRLVDCARGYIDLYLDDEKLITPPALREFRKTTAGSQFGVRLELSDQIPGPGRYVLKVVTHYPLEEETRENFRTTYIPFTVVQ